MEHVLGVVLVVRRLVVPGFAVVMAVFMVILVIVFVTMIVAVLVIAVLFFAVIVVIDPDKSKGQKQIVDACPYGAIYWNEALEIPQAWYFDAHLLDEGWTEPRCVDVCPTGALRSVKVDDAKMAKLAEDEALEPLRPELNTRPRVHYKNLWRYAKCFIGGTVSVEADGIVDCVEGATVRLLRDGQQVAEAATDGYGDFKIDRLDAESGDYVVEISSGAGNARREVALGESVNLGEIRLGR